MTPAERFSPAGRNALVIGGTSGIGKAIATGFLKSGATLVVAGKNETKLAAAVEDLRRHGSASGLAADVRADEAVRGPIGSAIARLGHLDILVNCQGMTTLKPALEFTSADREEILGTNLRSVFVACQVAGHHMLGRGRGAILSIGSLSSYRGWPRSALYGLSKTAVVSLTETLAAEWAAKGREPVGAAIYLCSDAAGYVTGETLRVDGGFLASGL